MGEKVYEILEFMIIKFLRRWMFSNLENRYYFVLRLGGRKLERFGKIKRYFGESILRGKKEAVFEEVGLIALKAV